MQLHSRIKPAKQFPDGYVKGERRFLQYNVPGFERILPLHPLQAVHCGTVFNHNSFGIPGRTRSVNDICQVIGRRPAFQIGVFGSIRAFSFQIQQLDTGSLLQKRREPALGHHQRSVAVLQ
ncbi:hypothetical protein D3C81_1561340 [compost metagenome]